MSIKPTKIDVNSTVTSDENNLSRTSILLTRLFGENDIIKKYDKLRKKIKQQKADKYCITEYEKCIAEIEVKLNIKEETTKEEFRRIEHQSLLSNKTINLIPTNDTDKNRYEQCLKELKYCKVLKQNFRF